MDINKELKQILGCEYGGPSLAYYTDVFRIYIWGDAPVSYEVIGEGATIEECILDYHKRKSKKVK